jgi:hypothetical protein
MSTATRDRLYELLPAIYRIRDAENGEPLHELLTIMGDELARIEDDIAGLHDDWFIETCAEWVIPYIGDWLTSASGPMSPTRCAIAGARARRPCWSNWPAT